MSQNGIHHVTAIAGDASRNLDFYTRILGQRFVKRTVNFDDPSAFHLYFGDNRGSPGTVMTFFPWPGASRGRAGVGELSETAYRIPLSAVEYWRVRLAASGVKEVTRFGDTVLQFEDPDGMQLALVGMPGIESEEAWEGCEIPAKHAVRGIHGVTLLLSKIEQTGSILTDVFGFREVARTDAATRYAVPGTTVGGIVDLQVVSASLTGQLGRGSVHHLAFRASDDATQAEMVSKLARNHGLRTTEQKDRDYFRSVYFREPGGVLFEIATDAPGFAVDEPADRLGTALKLPSFLEPRRQEIERALPPLVLRERDHTVVAPL
jgi:glyoxalase family protein